MTIDFQQQNLFFISDTHFGHEFCRIKCNRPFASIEEMDQVLIENWNSIVTEKDIVFFLGDFAFYKKDKIVEIRNQLKGQIHFIKGNHDQIIDKKLKNIWTSYHEMGTEIKVLDKDAYGGKQRIVLSHYSFQVWNQSHRDSWQLYGHSHGSLSEREGYKSCDIGVDVHDYKPVSYQDIKIKFSAEEYQYYKPIDHHNANKEDIFTRGDD